MPLGPEVVDHGRDEGPRGPAMAGIDVHAPQLGPEELFTRFGTDRSTVGIPHHAPGDFGHKRPHRWSQGFG